MEIENCGLLIVGAGHAGSELAISARQAGWEGPIVLLGDETALPYHRPPLSKAYLQGKAESASLALRAESAYATGRIDRRPGRRVASVDRATRTVTLADAAQLRYDKLAWCAGGRPRPLAAPGVDASRVPANLHYLRTIDDADRLRADLGPGRRVVVVGGGYVGLETAATARQLGAEVTVLEAQPRVLARVAGPEVSAFYESLHRAQGVRVLTGMQIAAVHCDGERITGVRCADGTHIALDCLVAGIGMIPNVEPLQAAGLADADGVRVDEHGCTDDPDIVAAGDCTSQSHPVYRRRMRLESVPNALEQARAAAAWLAGKPRPVASAPWFWSDQYDLKLQMAGLSAGHDRCVLRGDPAQRSFCAFYLKEGRLLAVDAVNRAAEFMLARRALAQPVVLDPERLADEGVALKALLA